MEREELRLELLKLTYSHGRETTEAVARAKILEDFVFEEKDFSRSFEGEKRKPGRPRKNVDTVDASQSAPTDI